MYTSKTKTEPLIQTMGFFTLEAYYMHKKDNIIKEREKPKSII